MLCVCLISCACYRLSDSEWCSCLGCIHSTFSPAVTWWLYSCGTLLYRNLDRVWSEKIGPTIQPYIFMLVAEILLQPTCMCESVCYRNSAHVFVSCAIVSSRLRKRGNSRTLCILLVQFLHHGTACECGYFAPKGETGEMVCHGHCDWKLQSGYFRF